MIRVLLADDHPLFREGLKYRLSQEPSIDVVAEAQDGEQALAYIEQEHCDVVLMDINMPKMNGMEVLTRINEQKLNCKVLMLSMHDSKEYILAAIRSGASGYVLKDVPGQELIDAIERVASGKCYFSLDVSEVLSAQLSVTQEPLTPRETLILKLISQGLNDKRIAQELAISARTAETHKRNIKKKLAINTTLGLVRYAIDHGFDK